MQLSFHKDKDEKRLVKALKAGKPDAQRRLYELIAGKMMALCLRYARNQEEAEDILQEGFMRIFRKIDTFKGDGSLEGWARKVITNVAIRQYQKNSRLHVVIGLDEVEYEMGEDVLGQSFAEDELLEMIRNLPDGYRMVFNLFAIEGFSHEEISKKLEITVGTSKSQLARARKSLRNMLENQQVQLGSKIING
jgi:RNA polymerase sigma-70 factor (ECF subfamily)